MWLKAVTLVVLSLQLVSANLECDGSAMNTDGFTDRPSEDKAALGEFPWVVALYKKDSAKPHCAGSIIDDRTVLTTSFCVKL